MDLFVGGQNPADLQPFTMSYTRVIDLETLSLIPNRRQYVSSPKDYFSLLQDKANKRLSMGPLKLAAMNGLSISRASVLDPPPGESRAPKDERVSGIHSMLLFESGIRLLMILLLIK